MASFQEKMKSAFNEAIDVNKKSIDALIEKANECEDVSAFNALRDKAHSLHIKASKAASAAEWSLTGTEWRALYQALSIKNESDALEKMNAWTKHDYKKAKQLAIWLAGGAPKGETAVFAELLTDPKGFTRERAESVTGGLKNNKKTYLTLLHSSKKGFALLEPIYNGKAISEWKPTNKLLKAVNKRAA